MSKNIAYRIYAAAFIATIIMLIIWIFLNHFLEGSVWNGMRISRSALTVEYCELNRTTAFFHQTMNTYSNLAYFFLGMIVILVSFYDKNNNLEANKNRVQQFPLLSFFFGCCLVYLCFGSAFFHASLTWPGQRVDMNGTYSVCIGLSGISLYRAFVKNDASAFLKKIYVIALFLLVLLFIELHLLISSFVLLPIIILLVTLITVINYTRNKGQFNLQFAIFSLALMIGAGILRILDVEKIGCDPTSFYQGHSLWHIFTGMSAFFLYWFYRSERIV